MVGGAWCRVCLGGGLAQLYLVVFKVFAVHLDAEARQIGARAGDLVIWRNDLPQGASPNTGTRPRMAQYVNMYSAELVTNPVWL